ncbi:MAG: hypothetical protein H7831_19040, partial [Magnetococcus sp. WYHC-3]
MADCSKARKNMVDCQIHTFGVVDPGVLEAFSAVPREMFVPDQYKTIAYNDEDIPLGDGRYMLEPAVYAKMVQALELKPDDVVLEIGGGSGYGAAVLSGLVSTVVVVESDAAFIERANNIWQALDLCNVALLEGPLQVGNA